MHPARLTWFAVRLCPVTLVRVASRRSLHGTLSVVLSLWKAQSDQARSTIMSATRLPHFVRDVA